MLQLTKEQLRELYKERDEALFFDYKPIKQKRNFIKWNKVVLDQPAEVFNHYISVGFLGAYGSFYKEQIQKAYSNKLNKKSFSSKQVVIKTLSNLDRSGAKNALAYVIRNSNSDFAFNQDGELKTLKELMNEWSKDFSHKKNAKEVLHLAFCIDETGGEYNQMRLKNAVEAVMQKNFFLYKYAMIIHSHQNKPHAHILLNKNNRMNGQKFHLNNAEFKLFFNQLRNDFAQALNAQGLQYHNHYKLENDLSKINNEINKNNFISKRNVLDELTQLQISVDKKIKAKQKKIDESKENLKELSIQRNQIIKDITQLKNIDIKHKGLWQLFKDLKEVNALIIDKKASMTISNKELKSLRADFNKFDYQKLVLRHEENQEFSTLLQKKKYLEFITSNLDRKTLTKSEINLKIKAIEQDIKLSENAVNEMIKERIKASLLTSSLLGKENNAFALTRAYTELTQNINILKQSDMDKEHYETFQKRLENNQVIILNLITQRFLLLQQEIAYKKQNKKLKLYQVKEYEKVSKFLNKDNALEIEKLYKLVEEISGVFGGGKTHNGSKINENSQSAAQNEKEITQSTIQNQAETNDESIKSQASKQTAQKTAEHLHNKMKSSGFMVRR